jgi:hypothetical protein
MINKRHFNILVWLVIALLALNLSALGTFLWFRFGDTPPMNQRDCRQKSGKQHFGMHDAYIRNEIGFDSVQMKEFARIREIHFTEIKTVNQSIRKTRKLQFEMLKQPQPNSVTLDSLSRQIGLLHHQWAMSSTDFILKTRELCTPVQQEKLFLMLEKGRNDEVFKARHHFRHRKGDSCTRPMADGPPPSDE